MKGNLLQNFSVEPVTKEVYDDFRREFEPTVFPNRFDINISEVYSAEERAGLQQLASNLGTPYELRLGFFSGSKMIGWSYGVQISDDTFRMITSGLLQDFQRRGIYSAYLGWLTEQLQGQGFQIVLSKHYATDNQIIVPKLRFGFLISGFELSDEYGMMVALSYYFNETRRKAMHMRSGLQQADGALRSIVRKYS